MREEFAFNYFQFDANKPKNEITCEDFEEAMKHARRSVTDQEVRRYELFAQTQQQTKGADAIDFKFPHRRGNATAEDGEDGPDGSDGDGDSDDEENLYA